METRRASIRFTHRSQSSSTTLGRCYATTASRIRWTTSALDRLGAGKHSNIDKCWKNLELLIQPPDQKLNDFDKEKQNIYEKYDVKKKTEQKK